MAVQDVITLSVVIAVLIVGGATGAFILTNVLNGFVATGLYDTTTQSVVTDTNAKWYTYLDYGVAIWFFLLWLDGLLLAYANQTSRVFFVVYILLFIISYFPLLTFGAFLGDFTDGFSVAFDNMPITQAIVQWWALFILFFGVTIGIALYAKSQTGGTLVG